MNKYCNFPRFQHQVLGSIVVSIPACHAGDRGSIPRRGGEDSFSFIYYYYFFFFPSSLHEFVKVNFSFSTFDLNFLFIHEGRYHQHDGLQITSYMSTHIVLIPFATKI